MHKLAYTLTRNYSYLLTANVLAAFIALASFAITTRAVSVDQFGSLVLVQTYILIIGQLMGFKTWQPVVKHGVKCLQSDNQAGLITIIQTAFCVDVVMAVAGYAAALLIAGLLSDWLQWSQTTSQLISLYAFVILLDISGAGMGILRIFDRFDLIAIQQVLFQLIRCAALLLCWLYNNDFMIIVICWVIPEIIAYLLLSLFALYELKRRNISLLIKFRPYAEFRKFTEFLVFNNFDSSIRLLSKFMDVLLVGLFFGQAQAGIYKLAVQLSGLVGKFTDPVYNILLPVFSKMVLEKKYSDIKSIVFKLSASLFVFYIACYTIFLLVGEPLVTGIFGEQYSKVYSILAIYLLGVGFVVICVAIIPLLHAHGMVKECFKVQFSTTGVYCILLLPLVYFWGGYGAAIAYIVYHIIWLSTIWPYFSKKLG